MQSGMAKQLPPPPKAQDGEQLLPRSLKRIMALRQGQGEAVWLSWCMLVKRPDVLVAWLQQLRVCPLAHNINVLPCSRQCAARRSG